MNTRFKADRYTKTVYVLAGIVLLLVAAYFAGSFLTFVMLAGPDEKVDRARMDVRSLEKAVMTYHLNYHLFPETLDILAQRQASGDPAYIEHHLLIDP